MERIPVRHINAARKEPDLPGSFSIRDINLKGSFTLISGALTDEPQLNVANASAANGAVDAFARATAIEMGNSIRINAVSPTVIEDSPKYFPFFPGEIPVTMKQLEFGFRKSVFGANTGQVIKPY